MAHEDRHHTVSQALSEHAKGQAVHDSSKMTMGQGRIQRDGGGVTIRLDARRSDGFRLGNSHRLLKTSKMNKPLTPSSSVLEFRNSPDIQEPSKLASASAGLSTNTAYDLVYRLPAGCQPPRCPHVIDRHPSDSPHLSREDSLITHPPTHPSDWIHSPFFRKNGVQRLNQEPLQVA